MRHYLKNLHHPMNNYQCLCVISLAIYTMITQAAPPKTETAIFAGGCFWCMEAPFDQIPGVLSTESGYTGGTVANPRYAEVSAGNTGHAEAVKITYDPQQVSYTQLLTIFWHNIDPTTPNQQFCDAGTQYRSAIFYMDESQHQLAEQSRQQITTQLQLKTPKIYTEITLADTFYLAEDYHQNYYQKNPLRYRYYRARCGRDERLQQLWGKTPAH